jgi:hypothetical protein
MPPPKKGLITVSAYQRLERAYAEEQEHVLKLIAQIDALLAHCPDAECSTCAEIICPHKDEMHFHHDGCPSCAMADEKLNTTP